MCTMHTMLPWTHTSPQLKWHLDRFSVFCRADGSLLCLTNRQTDRLDVPERVMYKLSVMMYSCLHSKAPQYLLDVCQPVSDVASRRHLRSASRRLLNVPHQRRSTFARRAFSMAGPLVWNSLPDYLRDPAVSRYTFYKHLKTFLFAVYTDIRSAH